MNLHRPHLLAALLALSVGLTGTARSDPAHTFQVQAPAFAAGEVSFGLEDGVDPVTGNRHLSTVDLHLPGKAGLDLTFVRSYSSKQFPLRSTMPGTPVVDTPLGLGWTLMAAPELYHEFPKSDVQDVFVRHQDGSVMQVHALAPPGESGENVFYSPSNWILVYDDFGAPTQMTLFSPTGVTYEYRAGSYRLEDWHHAGGAVDANVKVHLPATAWDVHRNTLCFSYQGLGTHAGRLTGVTDSYGRSAILTYSATGPGPVAPTLDTLSGGGRLIDYTVQRGPSWEGTQFNQLASVHDGDFQVDFAYGQGGQVPSASCVGGCPWLLTTVTYPTSATTRHWYERQQVPHNLPWQALHTVVATQRSVTGPGLNTGGRVTTWDYSDPSLTIIRDAEGHETVVDFTAYADVMPSDSSASVGQVDEVRRYQGTASGGTLLETIVHAYRHGDVQVVRDPEGSDELFTTDVTRRDLVETRTYRGAALPGNLLRRTTNLTWDRYGNVTKREVAPMGAPVRTTELEYKTCDPFLNIDPDPCNASNQFPFLVHVVHGLVTSRKVSEPGTTTYEEQNVHDDLGLLTSATVLDASLQGAPRNRQATFTHCPDGRMRTAAEWDGGSIENTTTLSYSDTLAGTTLTTTDSIDVSRGTNVTIVQRADGRVTSRTDRNGETWTYHYTPGGRLERTVTPKAPQAPDTTIDYADLWQANDPRITIQHGQSSTTHHYNGVLELLKSRSTAGPNVTTVALDRDQLGRVTRKSLPTFGNPATAQAAPAYVELTSDSLGRVLQRRSVAPPLLDQVTSFDYSVVGATTTTDTANRESTSEFDGLGRLVAITPPDGARTTFTYDHLDGLTSVRQPGVSERTFAYSRGGLLEQEFHPETGATSYEYDGLGRVTARAQRGAEVHTTYDARGRVTRIDYPDEPTRPATQFYHDGALPFPCTGACEGQLTGVIDETGQAHFLSYDSHGLPLTRRVTLDDPADGSTDLVYTLGYEYDDKDRLQATIYPSGRRVEVAVDTGNQVSGLAHRAGGDIALTDIVDAATAPMTYDARRVLQQLPFTSGVTETVGFDARNRPLSITVNDGTSDLLRLDYSDYDEVDNLLQLDVTWAAGPVETERFAYDALDRLESASLPEGTLGYDYDGAGNRARLTSSVATVAAYALTPAPGSNQFRDFVYDARGNVLFDGEHSYTYTTDNRIRTVDGRVTYYYDAEGNRVRREEDGGDTHLYAYGGLQLLSTWKLANTGPSLPQAPAIQQSETVLLHGDVAGTVRLRTLAGDVLETRRVGPFGEQRGALALPGHGAAAFAGKHRDAVSLLENFGARDYSSRFGRFASTDPAAFLSKDLARPQDFNLYQYGVHNPYRYSDPSGKFLDTFVDVASIVYDVVDIAATVIAGDEVTKTQVAALGADVAAAFIPFATGGGAAVRVAAHGDEVIDTGRVVLGAVTHGDEVVDGGRALVNTAEAAAETRMVANGAPTTVPSRGTAPGSPSAPGGCFVEGTLVAVEGGHVPIETLRVGDRVRTLGGGRSPVLDPEEWRTVEATLDAKDGAIELTMLRPRAWVDALDAAPGTVIPITVEELHVRGFAVVTFVGDCPPLAGGPGRLVLSTFTRTSNEVLRVEFVDSDADLEATDTHPLYSTDRRAWTTVRELVPGERLRSADGTAQVLRIQEVPGSHRVYNLQVDTEHSYLASRAELLSHNSCAAGGGAKRGPKPFGVGPHNQKIKEVADSVTDGQVIAGGQTGLPERLIPTPGGLKTGRRPDVLVQRPDGSVYGINVGKRSTRTGAPIKREVEAIKDLEGAGVEMQFVPYN